MKLSYNNYTARFCDGGVEVFKGDTLLYYNKRPMYAFIKTALAVTEFYDAPYETITEKDGSILAEGILRSPTGSQLHFSDSYGISDGAMKGSAERFGAVTELAEVYKASLSGRIKTLDTSEGVFQGRTVVIATGASPRILGVPDEEALAGKGVHYCAACDGAFYRGKTVAVVGDVYKRQQQYGVE